MKELFNMNLQLFAAESNVTTSANMSKVREVDFVNQFSHVSMRKLMEALGIDAQPLKDRLLYDKAGGR